MKVVVFGIANWDCQAQADYLKPYMEEWRNRVRFFVNDPEIFISTGTYSDPKYSPLNLPLVQNGITKTRPYSKNWNYFRNGFMTGCWNALLNMDFDVLFHIQCRNLLGTDMISNLHRFMDSTKQIMAPRFVSKSIGIDNSVDVSLMAMKPDAVRLFTSFGLRPSLSPFEQQNCETEALELFKDSWYNPYPEINTCSKRVSSFGNDGPDDMSKEEFMRLPFIAAQKHASSQDVADWCAEHTYIAKGGIMI